MSDITHTATNQANVLQAILERRSHRKFTNQPVPEEAVHLILEAGRWAPSADNAQPWYFVVVRDTATKERINWVARDSQGLYSMWLSSLPHAGDRAELPDFTRIPLCIGVFADGRESRPYVEAEQSHITAAAMAAQNMWLSAHALGLGACMWSHIEQDQIKTVLGVPHHEYFVGVLGIGYPDEDEPAGERERRTLEEVVGWEWFRVKQGQPVPPQKLQLLAEFLGI